MSLVSGQNGLFGPSTKGVRQNLGFLNHPSTCPGASEFTKTPLPGRPSPDFPIIIFTQFLPLAEKSKNWVNRRIRRLTPGRYTSGIQGVNCLVTGINYRLKILVDWMKI